MYRIERTRSRFVVVLALLSAVSLLAASLPARASHHLTYDMRIINQDASSWIVHSSQEPMAVATGDWDGNGVTDLAYSLSWSGQHWVKVENPGGLIIGSKEISYPANDIAMGDVNADGKDEVIFTRSCFGTVQSCAYVWYQSGSSWLVKTSDEYIEMAMGDWNGDGKADTAYTQKLSGTRYIRVDDPGGLPLFTKAEPRPVWTMDMGDIDSDVVDDLIFSTNEIPSTSYVVQPWGGYTTLRTSGDVMAVAAGDWHTIANEEIAYSESVGSSRPVRIYTYSGTYLFGKGMCTIAWEMAFGNLNGDSREELLYSDLIFSCS